MNRTRSLARLAAVTTTALTLLAAPALAEAKSEPVGTAAELPVTLSGSYLSARIAGQNNDIANAAAFYREALEVDPGNPFLLDRAFVLDLANGSIEPALELAERLIADQPDHFLARLALAADAVRKDDYATAVRYMEAGGRGPLAELTAGLVTAWALQAQGETDAALQTIAALQGPDWYIVFQAYHTALIQELAGQMKPALDNYDAAFGADRGALRVIDAFARAKAKAGDKTGALAILDEYDKLLPDHPLLVETRRAIQAGEPLPPVAADAKVGVAEVLYGLGAAIGRDGGEELAGTYLQLALYLDPKAAIASVALASLFERMKKPDRAIEILKKIDPESPLKRDAEVQIGLDYNALDNLEGARRHLSALVDSDPSDLEAVTALGNVLRGHKLFKEAEEAYTRGIETIETPQEKHWTLYYYRGICRERLKTWPEAEADFRQALALYPDQPLVLNYLGYSLVDQGLKLDEALEMIRKAVELRPKDGYIVDSLGWAYYKLGRYEEAVAELEKAIELRPEDPVINDHLGDAYWKVGRRLEARFQWNHARDLGPEPEDLSKILNKIANGLSEAEGAGPVTAEQENKGGG